MSDKEQEVIFIKYAGESFLVTKSVYQSNPLFYELRNLIFNLFDKEELKRLKRVEET